MKKEQFENMLDTYTGPIKEVFLNSTFSDWRLSYGMRSRDVYFISIYPAFCLSPKFTLHYEDLDLVFLDIYKIYELYEGLEESWSMSDVLAALLSVLRNKESIELFQEQKDLMDLGLKHFRLDNFYQDQIKTICKHYYSTGKIFGKNLDLTMLKKVQESNVGQ